MLSIKELHNELGEMLALIGNVCYIDIRKFFVNRAAENTVKPKEENILFVPRKQKGTKSYSWCKSRGRKYNNYQLKNCHGLKRKQEKKGRGSGTINVTDTTVILAVLMTKTHQHEKKKKVKEETTTE